MALSVETTADGQITVITVRGDVDLYTSPELRTAILDAVPASDGDVAVDLGGVGYMDSSGVATLVEGLRSAHDHAKRFRLVAPSPAVLKVLKLARLDSVFEIDSSP